MSEEKDKVNEKDINNAIGKSIDDISEVTKTSARQVFDVLVEEGVKTVRKAFDKYTKIAKHKVTTHGQTEEKNRRSE